MLFNHIFTLHKLNRWLINLENLIMAKLIIGKIIMFKPTTTKVIMEKLMIIKLIMAKPTKNKNNHD